VAKRLYDPNILTVVVVGPATKDKTPENKAPEDKTSEDKTKGGP
jgi:hypothetical protein